MLIRLIATNKELYSAWKKEFRNTSGIQIIHGSIFDYPSEAIVSPANSFGVMDGGLDGKLRDYFGMSIEIEVKKCIKEKYLGELPVGCALSVITGRSEFPFLISAPTMRVPENVATTINAYLAMRASLIESLRNKFKSIAVPGLCSLSGEMPLHIVARQMKVAYEKVVTKTIEYTHWREEKALQEYMHCRTDALPYDLEL